MSKVGHFGAWLILPGTKMSPKPSKEKGRSHKAKGEKFSLGTLSTIGSCAIKSQKNATKPKPRRHPQLHSAPTS